MKRIFYLLAMFAVPAMAQVSTVSTMEDTEVTFNENGYWNGGKIGTPQEGSWGEEVYPCTFTSGKVTGTCTYNYMTGYDWWGGVALSQRTSTAFETLDDQYNNVVGTGANESQTFAVIYGNESVIDVNVEGGALVHGLYVTNSAYTHNNITVNTGSYDTKFTAEGDHFYLNIVATKADGTTKTAVVKLAEFTTELSYVQEWQYVGLDSLGTDVTKLTFNFDCNKPMVATYACIDDIDIVSDLKDVADFENLTLEPESYWNGTDGTASFMSGRYQFENGYQDYSGYAYCYGFYYTNMTSTTYGGDAATEQYKSCVGHGVENSANYATYNINTFDAKGINVLGAAATVKGFYVTNNAYAYTSMKNGDSYAKQFGLGDWLKLTVTGYDATGAETGTKDFYLADLREADKAYIINKWYYVDLSTLGAVSKIGFAMSSSDTGEWGMNTPAYFCMDNFGAEGTEVVPEKNIDVTGIETINGTAAKSVARYNLNGVSVQGSQKGLNIIRMSDGSVRKVMVK